MRLFILCLASVLAGCLSVTKQHPERPDESDRFAVADSHFTLRGTKFYVLTDQTQTDIHLEVRYIIGADRDPVGKEGLAHVVEHLLFEVPVGDLEDSESYGKALSKLSLNWNAFTSLDTTSYLTTLPKKSLVSVLNLEMMRSQRGCRGLTEEAFLREREVVRNEARERDLGGPSIGTALSEFLYPKGHPYRRSVIGTDSSLTSITMKDACDFMDTHYHANNRIIVVSGPVRAAEVSTLARALLGPALPHQERASVEVPPLNPASDGGATIDLDIETPLVIATWPMAAVGTQRYRRQQQVLNGLGAMLDTAASDEDWIAGVGVAQYGGPKAPAMIAYVLVSDVTDLPRAEVLINDARKKTLKKKGKYIHSFLLQRQLLLNYEDQESRTGLFAHYLQHSETGFAITKHFSELEETSEEEIAVEAESVLDRPGRPLRIHPEETVFVRDTSSVSIDAPPPRQQSFLEPDAAMLAAANEELPIPEHVGAKQQFRRYQLANGLTLLFWQNEDLPLVHGSLVLPVGSAHVSATMAGISNLLPGSDGPDATVFSQSTMAKNADGLMYLLAESFKSSKRIVSQKDIETMQVSMATEEAMAQEAFEQNLKKAIFGANHPYTRTSFTRTSLGNLTKSSVANWAKTHRSVRGATLILTGRFNPKLMYKLALYYFGSKPDYTQPKPPPMPALPNTGAVVSGIDDASASLDISIIFRTRKGTRTSTPARQVLTMIISNRLQRLREVQALTYGMHASFGSLQEAGLWGIRGSVDPARSAEAMQSLLLVIAELRNNPSSYIGEFANARSVLMSSFNSSQPSAAAAAQRLTNQSVLQLEDDYYEHYVRALARLSPQDVQTLLEAEFESNQRVIGLLGPQAAIVQAREAIKTFRYKPGS
tara:strand:+ start:18404 stop:21046 length:2643 start_codon:yes stop_codon:yes gene_type:complete